MSIKKNRNKEKVTASGVENVQRLFHTMTPREKLFSPLQILWKVENNTVRPWGENNIQRKQYKKPKPRRDETFHLVSQRKFRER